MEEYMVQAVCKEQDVVGGSRDGGLYGGGSV